MTNTWVPTQVAQLSVGGTFTNPMSERGSSRDSIRQLAGRVATTEHAALDEETVHDVIDYVRDVDERIQAGGSADAIRDLLTFWEGYVRAGLDADASTDAATRDSTLDDRADLPGMFERGNDADLYGLDLYQGLLQLAQSYEGNSDGGNISDRTIQWAERVSGLTRDFVDHLEDHI